MKIVKFGGKSLANGGGINTVLDIIEGKKSKKKKSLSWFQQEGKQLMSWTIFLLLQPKRKLQTTLESFKTFIKEVLMQLIFRQNLIN
jgi:hypothetical protein